MYSWKQCMLLLPNMMVRDFRSKPSPAVVRKMEVTRLTDCKQIITLDSFTLVRRQQTMRCR